MIQVSLIRALELTMPLAAEMTIEFVVALAIALTMLRTAR